MKNFMMNKLSKTFLSLFVIGIMAAPINAFASTNLNGQQAIINDTTTKFISIFPSFKESLDKDTNGNKNY